MLGRFWGLSLLRWNVTNTQLTISGEFHRSVLIRRDVLGRSRLGSAFETEFQAELEFFRVAIHSVLLYMVVIFTQETLKSSAPVRNQLFNHQIKSNQITNGLIKFSRN